MTAELDWAWMKASVRQPLFFVGWFFGILTLASWRVKAIRWKLAALTVVFLVMMQGNNLLNNLKAAQMEVMVFDVGQGDATLITTPLGKHILIDTGIWTPSENSGEQVILPYLKASGIEKLEAIVLSHPHADHIGGILSLLEGIRIDSLYNSGFQYDSELYNNYIRLAGKGRVPVKSLSSGEQLMLDSSILLTVLGPVPGLVSADPNQHSVILRIDYGSSSFLFVGDAGEKQESLLVNYYSNLLDVDFLKVGHHGSRTSSESHFLEAVSPEIAVVSLGVQNRFNHPHQEAVRRLKQSKAQLYFTSRDKALRFISDGDGIKLIKWE